MSKRAIFAKINQFFAKIEKFSAPLGLFMVFALAGLTFLNNQLNFDIPASAKVRDAANFAESFTEVDKLDIRSVEKSLATTFAASVPSAGYSYYAPATTSASATTFHIGEPVLSGDLTYILDWSPMRYTGSGSRFLYGHSSTVFSPLKSLYAGSTFTATIDGVTSTYVISTRYSLSKATLNSDNNLRTAIYAARDPYTGVRHSLSLMTCGNGNNDDGNFRLVFFADKI